MKRNAFKWSMGNLEAMVTIQHPEGFAKPQTGFRSKRLIKQAINSFCCTQLLENKGCQEKKKQQTTKKTGISNQNSFQKQWRNINKDCY